MQLIKKLFGRPPASVPGPGPETSQFHESETTTEQGSRNAPRRELVQVVLRDTMRRHGIPSSWIDCRILSVVSRSSMSGMHVQLIVRDGVDRLLNYVPAFQGSFMDEIARFDPRVDDWLFSLAWQFQNFNGVNATMPDPGVWAGATVPAALAPSAPPVAAPPAADNSRQKPPVPPRSTPAPMPAAATRPPRPPATQAEDAEVMEDLQALFAIRDAAMRAAPGQEQPDFQPTQPGADESAAPPEPGKRRW
jgi:hypothetical protein